MGKKLCAECAEEYRAAGYDVAVAAHTEHKAICAHCGKKRYISGILLVARPKREG